MSVELNVKVREAAEAAIEVAEDVLGDAGLNAEFKKFWTLVSYYAAERGGFQQERENPCDTPRMSDAQARAFGEQIMPWGKHKGDRVADVPLDYLIFVTENPDEFRQKLKLYLASDSIQAEM